MIRQKTWPRGTGLSFPIHVYLYRKLQKSSCQKRFHWTDFNIIWLKRFFGDPLLIYSSHHKRTWPRGGGGAYFPYVSILKTLKIFLSETTGPILILLGRNVPLVTLYQDCSSSHESSKTMAASRGGGGSLIFPSEIFPIYLLFQFQYNFAEMIF